MKRLSGKIGLTGIALLAMLQSTWAADAPQFEVDPFWGLKLTSVRAKWIDQSQSHNVFIKGTSGKLLSDLYLSAWRMGLKTTYYLRTLAASQIEKATVDAARYGYTQKREYSAVEAVGESARRRKAVLTGAGEPDVSFCRVDDPECEACQ